MRKFAILIGALALGFGLVLAQADDSDDRDDAAPAQLLGATSVQLSAGGFLVDAEGRALYLFTNDSPGISTCEDNCLVNWPPLLYEGELSAGSGINADLLDTIERDDSTTQVTYNGWPLYYYIGDSEAGATAGQGVGDVWYLVDAAGNAIESLNGADTGDDAADEADDDAGDDQDAGDDAGSDG